METWLLTQKPGIYNGKETAFGPMFPVSQTETWKVRKGVGRCGNSQTTGHDWEPGLLSCAGPSVYWKTVDTLSASSNWCPHAQFVKPALRESARPLPKLSMGLMACRIVILIVLFLSPLLLVSFVASSCDEMGGWAASSRTDASWFGRLASPPLSLYLPSQRLTLLSAGVPCRAQPSLQRPGCSHVTQPYSPWHLFWFSSKFRNCFLTTTTKKSEGHPLLMLETLC